MAAKETPKNPKLFEKISAALNHLHQKQKAKYDGVLGSLPNWVPRPLKHEFETIRDFLLDQYNHQDILRYMNARNKIFTEEGFRWSPHYPEEIEDKLDSLIYIKTLVEMGENNGEKAAYDAYLGKGGYEVYRGVIFSEKNKQAAKAKRSGPFHDLVSNILKSNPNFGWKEVLHELEDHVDGNVIDALTDKEIQWVNRKGEVKIFKVSSLPSLVSRLKKFLR